MSSETAPSLLLRHPLLFYVRRFPRALATGIGLLILTDLLDAVWPLVLKTAIDRITAGHDFSEIGRLSLIFFAIMASLALSRYGWRVGIGRFHTRAGEDLRLRAFANLSRLTPGFLLRTPVGELMSVLTNDIQTFRNGIGSGLLVFIDGVIILVFVLPIMFSLNATWTWASLSFLPLVPLMIWWVMRSIHTATRRQQDATGRVTAHSQESIAGIRVVKGFALEDLRLRSFNEENLELERASNSTAKIDSLFMPVMEFGVTTGTVLFLFTARQDLVTGAASVGTFVAFHRYILKTVWPMTALGMGLSQLQKGFASFERVRDLLSQKPDLRPAGTTALKAFHDVEFRDVGFKYPGTDRWVLRHVNFTLKRGDSLGLAGPVASGKTTLMALLTRQFDPTEGEIFVNGTSIHDYAIDDVRACFTLVPQDVFLFSETVTSNIGFGTDQEFSAEDAAEAARQVDIHDEIARLPDGYDSMIGEKGVNLSGGQKQRMALARGLAIKAEVLLLDDVLSAVDTRTERTIDALLETQRRRGQTQILVAHRLSTLQSCDRLLILNDGRVEAFGDRPRVIENSPFLQRLRLIQDQPEVTP